jgi:hypothetical protein
MTEDMKNEEPIILTFDDVEYRASDLSDDQRGIAIELSEIVPQLQRLERDHAKFNRFKNYLIQDFQRSLEVETPEDAQPEESE